MNTNGDFAIDPFRLDDAWLKQSSLVIKYGEHLADRRMAYDTAKNALEITEAELDLEIRKDPEKYSIEKVSEASIQSAIKLSDRRQTAVEKMLKAKHAVAIAETAFEALQHKRYALENNVKLFLSQYHAEPKPPAGATREQADELKQKARKESLEKHRPVQGGYHRNRAVRETR